MKFLKFFFIIGLMIITYSCSKDDNNKSKTNLNQNIEATSRSSAIGQIVNGTPKFTGNATAILTSWNNSLPGLNPNLTQLSISQNLEGAYIIVATGDEYKSTRLLQLDGTVLSYNGGSGTTCTTKSCSHDHGCEVTVDGRCSPCSGDCTKTSSGLSN